MRRDVKRQSSMLSLKSPAEQIPSDHPLRRVKDLADGALAALSPTFDSMYSKVGRPASRRTANGSACRRSGPAGEGDVGGGHLEVRRNAHVLTVVTSPPRRGSPAKHGPARATGPSALRPGPSFRWRCSAPQPSAVHYSHRQGYGPRLARGPRSLVPATSLGHLRHASRRCPRLPMPGPRTVRRFLLRLAAVETLTARAPGRFHTPGQISRLSRFVHPSSRRLAKGRT